MALFKPKKRSGGQFYQAVGVYQGIRVRQSLGTADYALAREACVEYEHKVLTGQVKVGTVERVMRQSTAIPAPSFRLVRSGDAKIDCRIAGARCSENGGSGDKKKLTEAFSLGIAGGLL